MAGSPHSFRDRSYSSIASPQHNTWEEGFRNGRDYTIREIEQSFREHYGEIPMNLKLTIERLRQQ